MTYVDPNYPTKKALREAVADGVHVFAFEPGLGDVRDGTVYLEGPHYPKPHVWYATGEVRGGKIISIK